MKRVRLLRKWPVMLLAAALVCLMVSMTAMAEEEETEYTYEIYYLDDLGDTWYSNCKRVLYLKTDDPEPPSLRAADDAIEITNYSGTLYDDIEYLNANTYYNGYTEVEGGWTIALTLDTEDESLYDTDVEIEIRGTGCSFTAHLVSYTQARYEWIDSYIDAYTTEDMDSFEKMQAVCNEMRDDFKYNYYNAETEELVYLASDPDTPCFLSYRTNSYNSPALLVEVAERIGGFDDIHNCYGDYTIGTSEWSAWHHYCACTIGDETEYYTICPTLYTNLITTEEIEMIDFSDTDSLTLAQMLYTSTDDGAAEDTEDSEAEDTEDSEEVSSPDYLSCLQDEDCPISAFTDADPAAWYHDGVHFCLENDLMNGTSTATFEPDTSTTRSMIVTMLYRLAGSPDVSGWSTTFTDVESGSWYEDAVIWAENKDIANGYDTGEFGVSDPVTREQIAAFFYRYAEYILECDMTVYTDLSDANYDFMDVDEVSSWAYTELSWAVENELITGQGVGSETYLAPGSEAMRSETATILMRFMENLL